MLKWANRYKTRGNQELGWGKEEAIKNNQKSGGKRLFI